MRLLKIILIILTLCGISVVSLSCGSKSNPEAVPENQVVTVQRGDLVIDITASGNLELSRTEDLAIELFYGQSGSSGTKGTIGEVLVEEGDTVEAGQVLVKLDTDEWDDELSKLEKALTTAQRNLTSKERDLTEAERELTDKERDITKAERQITVKELAVRQAELDLQTAEYNLYETDKVKDEKDAVDAVEFELRVAQVEGHWQELLYWKERLAQAEEDLREALQDIGITASSDAALQSAKSQVELEFAECKLAVDLSQKELEDAQIAVEDAELALKDAQLDKEYAEQDVEDAKLDVEDAKQDVEDARSDLDEAKSLSPEITAPFAGFVTKVNVEGGDEVLKGTVAVQIADPNKFEAKILVSEMDIMQVKIGGEASVQVDAMTGLSLLAKVTHIAPTATIQSGVVNYQVKVEIQPLEEMMQERQEARQEAIQKIQQGELPEPLRQAIEEGRIPQEQAEEIMKRIQQGEGGPPGPPSGTQVMKPEDIQLREGLTVTVSIIVQEKTDVLLVPNAAITTEGRQSYVQVVSSTGTIEKRAIQTGITDYQNTEVIEGLIEGEKVVVPQGTTSTSTSPPQRPPMFIPGMGRR